MLTRLGLKVGSMGTGRGATDTELRREDEERGGGGEDGRSRVDFIPNGILTLQGTIGQNGLRENVL